MKPRLTFICLCLGVLAMAPAMFADVTDYLLNVNGTSYCPAFTQVAGCSNTGLAGAGASSLNLSTGLGTVSLTYNPGPGTYNVAFWLFEQLSQPGWNEYGNTGGSAAAGQTWQIDVPDYDYNSTDPNFGNLASGAGTIIANTLGTLANTNFVPGSTDTFNLDCTGPTCNDYVSMAMGFGFTLVAGDEEVVSFNVSSTVPTSGFYLEQIHPVDGANSSPIDYYFTGSASEQPIGTTTVPEPGSWILLATLVAVVLTCLRRRSATT